MAAFSITTDTVFDTIAGKTAAGFDTFNISNNATLTVDTDMAYCAQPTVGMSTFSIAATGGKLKFDGTKVRLIPYDTGSGNVPAIGTSITQGGVSGYLLGVWASIGVVPTAAGAAMPASGYIKIKNKTGGDYASGALGGIAASATGPDVVGWIRSHSRNAAVTIPALGSVECIGDWFEVGVTSGARNQTVQLPYTSGTAHYPGVWIETSAGSGVYEGYPNAIMSPASASTGTGERAKVVWIDGTGVCRIGHDGTNAVGFLPGAGRKVRIPNVMLEVVASNGVIGGQYNSLVSNTLSISGRANLSHMMTEWGFACTSGSVVEHCSTSMSIIFAGVCTANDLMAAYSVGTTANSPVTLIKFDGSIQDQCYVTANDLVSYIPWPTLSAQCLSVVAAVGSINNARLYKGGVTTNQKEVCVAFYNALDLTLNNTLCVGGSLGNEQLSKWSEKIRISNTRYASTMVGTTVALTNYALFCYAPINDLVVDGVSFLTDEANLHPYTSVVNINGIKNGAIRNLGTPVAPLNMGTVNPGSYLISSAGSGAGNLKISRGYMTNAAAGLVNANNMSGVDIVIQNIYGDFADTQRFCHGKGQLFRGCAATPNKTSGVTPDAFWADMFTSATTGVLLISFSSQLLRPIYSGMAGARFDNAGGVYLSAIGNTLTAELNYYMLGHTGFQNVAPVMDGGTIGNYSLEFQYDLHNLAGYNGTWLPLTGANLAAVPVSATAGIKLKIRITTTTANAAAITFLSLATTTNSTAMYTNYTLTSNAITFTGLPVGTDIVALTAGTTTVLSQQDSNPTSAYTLTYDDAPLVDIGFIKSGYIPHYIRNLQLTAQDSTLPVALVPDRNYQ